MQAFYQYVFYHGHFFKSSLLLCCQRLILSKNLVFTANGFLVFYSSQHMYFSSISSFVFSFGFDSFSFSFNFSPIIFFCFLLLFSFFRVSFGSFLALTICLFFSLFVILTFISITYTVVALKKTLELCLKNVCLDCLLPEPLLYPF